MTQPILSTVADELRLFGYGIFAIVRGRTHRIDESLFEFSDSQMWFD